MQTSGLPTRMPTPFADSGVKQTIPIASQIGITPGRASFTDGFPPLTRTPIAAGGVPPYGTDFNGILNAITAALRWSAAGSAYPYDSAFSTAVSGYPKGAFIPKAAFTGYWFNTVEGNTANPDSGGSGWIDGLGGRLLGVRAFSTTGTSTYTPTPGMSYVVVEGVGGGGAGGGAPVTSSGNVGGGAGGNAGAYGKGQYTAAQVGASLTITVGAGGVGSTGGGSNGGTTSFGSLLSLGGGAGASSFGNSAPPLNAGNGNALAGATGANLTPGVGATGVAAIITSTAIGLSGQGASTSYGAGGASTNVTGNGIGASGFGAGGGGALAMSANATARTGGNGYQGFLLVLEYA